MGVSAAEERCPQCSSEGYRYDAVCHIWCCGRCQTTETTEEKAEREERVTVSRVARAEGRAGF